MTASATVKANKTAMLASLLEQLGEKPKTFGADDLLDDAGTYASLLSASRRGLVDMTMDYCAPLGTFVSIARITLWGRIWLSIRKRALK